MYSQTELAPHPSAGASYGTGRDGQYRDNNRSVHSREPLPLVTFFPFTPRRRHRTRRLPWSLANIFIIIVVVGGRVELSGVKRRSRAHYTHVHHVDNNNSHYLQFSGSWPSSWTEERRRNVLFFFLSRLHVHIQHSSCHPFLSFLSSWNVVGGWLTGYAGAQCQLVWRLIKNLLARYPPTTRADALAISFFPSSLPSFTPPAPLLVSVLLYI